MADKIRINTERIRFIGYLFFNDKSELNSLLKKWDDQRHFDRLWNGTGPCTTFIPALAMLGFSTIFVLHPYPPEIGAIQNKEALNIQGTGIPPRPFLADPTIDTRPWQQNFLQLSNDEQMNRIDAYCADIRKFRLDPNNTNKVNLRTIPTPPKQEDIDRLVNEFHFKLTSLERRDRIVEWFSYQHPTQH